MMMMKLHYLALRYFTLGLLLAAGCWTSGCGSARRGVPVDPPLALTDTTLAHGQRTFMRFCNGCHPGGTSGVGLAINNKPLPAFALRYQIRKGVGVMPGFSEEAIPDGDLDALVAYLQALHDHPD